MYAAPEPILHSSVAQIYLDEIVNEYKYICERMSTSLQNTISKIKWFNFDADKAKRFKESLKLKQIKAGQIIYDVGEKSQHFFILHEGRVRIDSQFKVENITKWPVSLQETEWSFVTKKVLRTLVSSLEAQPTFFADGTEPAKQNHLLFGHNDLLANQRPRIIRAVALTDCIVLIGTAQTLFTFLSDPAEIKAITESVTAVNPYDIANLFVQRKIDREDYCNMF